IGNFIAAATTATAGIVNVIESFFGINHHEPPIDFEAFERDDFAVFFRETRNVVHDGENRVRHRDGLKGIFGKTDFDFLAKGFVPFFIGATGAYEEKAAFRQIFSQLLPLLLRQRKRFVAGHHAEGKIEERIGVETNRTETRIHAEVGLAGDFAEKTVGETNGAFVAGVNEIAALQECELGVNRWGGGGSGLLSENWRTESAQR